MSEQATVTFWIDGKEVRGREADTIVEAARQAGIYIPTLCHCPGVISPGTCRVCTVKINGRYAAACKTRVVEGARVESDTPELNELRKTLIEALFVEGNHFCPACEKSGNCMLQALAYRLGMLAPRFEFQFPQREVEAGPAKLMIDRNRCIFCKRCVLSIQNEKGEHLFNLANRGHTAKVMVDVEKANALSDEQVQKAMDTCPVGAIIRKGRGFVEPIGTRRYDKAAIGSDIQESSLKREK